MSKQLRCFYCDKLMGYAADSDLYDELWVWKDLYATVNGKNFVMMCIECREKSVDPLYPKPIKS